MTEERLRACDGVLILTAHSAFDYDQIVRLAPLVFDTRNGTKGFTGGKSNVVLL